MAIPTTNFSIETFAYIKSLEYDEQNEYLKYHQYIVNKFMLNRRQRGILIYHSMGFGKTILAGSICEEYRKVEPTRIPIVLLPKSLQENFRGALKVVMKSSNDDMADESIDNTIEEHYNFVSLNSSNMFVQIGKVDKTPEEVEFEKKLGLINEQLENRTNLENTIMIIDEFHNLSNAITNGSKNAIKLYNKIMNTKDIKLIFLTGTPLINHPFESVCMMNMLHGTRLFPENIRDFISFFIDKKNNTIKNKDKYQNRITGLVSYYGDKYFSGTKPGFPEEYPVIIEYVPMSKEQLTRYLTMREIEKKEEMRRMQFSSGDNVQFNEKSGKMSSSYRIRSRQVSNFLIPDVALTSRGTKSDLKNLNKIPPEAFKKLEVYSPKFKKILDNITKYKSMKSLFFSQFTSAEGLALFGKVLEAHGYAEWNTDNMMLQKERRPTFAYYSGNISASDRNEIVEQFNSKDNMHGEIITIMLVSNQTGALGLDLHGVRSIHIAEPYWNWALITQIIKRGSRYRSHEGYPENEQNVQPYIYLSDLPKSYKVGIKNEVDRKSTDVHIYERSIENLTLINSFLKAIIEASVDCSAHHKNLSDSVKKEIHCHMCSPTDSPLYELDFYRDMKMENPCKPFEEVKMNVKEIIFEPSVSGEKIQYFYNDDDKLNIKIFERSKEVDGYVPLRPSHPNYSDLMRKILKI